MASTIRFFLLPEDERALLRRLGQEGLTAYPELVPPGFEPPAVTEGLADALGGSAWYLAAERLGPVIARPVRRGPEKGMLKIEEVPSPVFHLERSLRNDAGELVAGRLWVDLEGGEGSRSQPGKPWALSRIFDDLQAWCRKALRRSDPRGWWVGPRAAEAWKRGDLALREAGHKGRLVGVWR